MGGKVPDSINPELMEKVARLELKARMVVEGHLAGMHKSPFRGFNVEFLEHRQYTAGDDIRHVDWKLYGKRDKYFIKQFEEETNLRAYLLLDSSASMQYGPGGGSKLVYASQLAACLAYMFIKQGDEAGLVTFDSGLLKSIPPKGGRAHLYRLFEALESNPGGSRTDVAGALSSLGEQLKRRSSVVLISDLLVEPGPVLEGLKVLRRRHSELAVFHLLDRAEVDFPFSRASRFTDVETGAAVAVEPAAIRREYKKNLEKHIDMFKRFCAGNMIEFVSAVTDEPLEKVLLGYLRQRDMGKRTRHAPHAAGGGRTT